MKVETFFALDMAFIYFSCPKPILPLEQVFQQS